MTTTIGTRGAAPWRPTPPVAGPRSLRAASWTQGRPGPAEREACAPQGRPPSASGQDQLRLPPGTRSLDAGSSALPDTREARLFGLRPNGSGGWRRESCPGQAEEET
jgi:hypothetical protein